MWRKCAAHIECIAVIARAPVAASNDANLQARAHRSNIQFSISAKALYVAHIGCVIGRRYALAALRRRTQNSFFFRFIQCVAHFHLAFFCALNSNCWRGTPFAIRSGCALTAQRNDCKCANCYYYCITYDRKMIVISIYFSLIDRRFRHHSAAHFSHFAFRISMVPLRWERPIALDDAK